MVANATMAKPSDFDGSFGGFGIVGVPPVSDSDTATGLAFQVDGKIIVSGYCRINGKVDFCVRRFNRDGSLDPSFGSAGLVTTTMGTGFDGASSLVLQPDGKIVVGGSCSVGATTQICLARYDTNGTLDSSFGNGGKSFTTLSEFQNDRLYSLALLPDGKLIGAGACDMTRGGDLCAMRFDASGNLDDNFGEVDPYGNSNYAIIYGNTFSRAGVTASSAFAVATDSQGRIVLSATCNFSDGTPSTRSMICVARFIQSGQPDNSFGDGGLVTTRLGNTSFDNDASSIAIQSGNRIVVGGTCLISTNYQSMCMIRYNENGTLDTTFNATGSFIGGAGATFGNNTALIAQLDGKLISAGICDNVGRKVRFCFQRVTTDGRADESFAQQGFSIDSYGANTDYRLSKAALQPDGKIVAAGRCNAGFCLTRYLGGPFGEAAGTLANWSYGDGRTSDVSIGTTNDFATTGFVQRNGKVVLAGQCDRDGFDPPPTYDSVACMMRFDSSGSILDPTFRGTKLGREQSLGTLAIDFQQPATSQPQIKASFTLTNDSPANEGYLAVNHVQGGLNLGLVTVAQGNPLNWGAFPPSISFTSNGLRGGGSILFTGRPFSVKQRGGSDRRIIAANCEISGSSTDKSLCTARLWNGGYYFSKLDDPPTGTPLYTTAAPTTDFAIVNPQINALRLDPLDGAIIAATCETGLLVIYGCLISVDKSGDVNKTFYDDGSSPLPGMVRMTDMLLAYDVAAQPDRASHNFVALGLCSSPSNQNILCLVTVNRIGTRISSQMLGNLPWPINPNALTPPRLLPQSDGKLVVAYGCTQVSSEFTCIARYNADGSPDLTFVGNGASNTGSFLLPISGTGLTDRFSDLSIAPDGKILVVGSCRSGNYFKFCAALLNGGGKTLSVTGNNGSVSVSDALLAMRYLFGFRGSALTNGISFSENTTRRQASVIEPFLEQLTIRPANDSSRSDVCWLGISGSNPPTATVDGLLMIRAALGLRGPSLVAGIKFPSTATRTTADQILSFLAGPCAMPW
jgi:uncharacterized delta-60 repeat protein